MRTNRILLKPEADGVTMRSIHAPATGNLRGRLLYTTIAALCAALAAGSSPAQEGAAAAGADAPQAGDGAVKGQPPDAAATVNRDVELVAPRRGAASLWRRAHVKTLIANTATTVPGSPAVNTRINPLPLHPGIAVSLQRNAIGLALPGPQPLGHDIARLTTSAGTGLTGNGAAVGGAGGANHQIPASTNAGVALRGTGINGTRMGRLAAGSASIGGPARDQSGINGTLMRLKRH
jgi:hypothetical protein